jgi:hypothetical protein
VNYSALVTLIQDYCESTESSFVSNIPTFVQLAEERIYNSVQIPAIRKNVTGTMTINLQYFQLPSDWLSTFSLAVIDPTTGDYEYLLNKDVNFIRQAYPNPSDDKAIPRYYAIFGPRSDNEDELAFILGPTPDASYEIELHYYYYPESITVAANGRTWLGDNFDSVLFYGALVEAATYMKQEADLVALYNQKYSEALTLAKRLGDGLERSDAYRSGQSRLAPLPQNNGVK